MLSAGCWALPALVVVGGCELSIQGDDCWCLEACVEFSGSVEEATIGFEVGVEAMSKRPQSWPFYSGGKPTLLTPVGHLRSKAAMSALLHSSTF